MYGRQSKLFKIYMSHVSQPVFINIVNNAMKPSGRTFKGNGGLSL
jgi:hypothetical protein